jgi:hypothetical protein
MEVERPYIQYMILNDESNMYLHLIPDQKHKRVYSNNYYYNKNISIRANKLGIHVVYCMIYHYKCECNYDWKKSSITARNNFKVAIRLTYSICILRLFIMINLLIKSLIVLDYGKHGLAWFTLSYAFQCDCIYQVVDWIWVCL